MTYSVHDGLHSYDMLHVVHDVLHVVHDVLHSYDLQLYMMCYMSTYLQIYGSLRAPSFTTQNKNEQCKGTSVMYHMSCIQLHMEHIYIYNSNEIVVKLLQTTSEEINCIKHTALYES